MGDPLSATGANPATFPWAVVGELAFVVYVYAATFGRGEHRRVYLGLSFWAVELVWEILNGSIGHFFGAPLFGVAGASAWVIYRGINIEISLMFAVAPLVLFHLLPEDRERRLWGLPNRWVVPCLLGAFCVATEVLLNRAGVLVWTWPFWRWPHVELILVAYCAPFVVLAWYYDRTTDIVRCRNTLLASAALLVACHLVFQTWLGWARGA